MELADGEIITIVPKIEPPEEEEGDNTTDSGQVGDVAGVMQSILHQPVQPVSADIAVGDRPTPVLVLQVTSSGTSGPKQIVLAVPEEETTPKGVKYATPASSGERPASKRARIAKVKWSPDDDTSSSKKPGKFKMQLKSTPRSAVKQEAGQKQKRNHGKENGESSKAGRGKRELASEKSSSGNQCRICKKKFAMWTTLQEHMQEHNEEDNSSDASRAGEDYSDGSGSDWAPGKNKGKNSEDEDLDDTQSTPRKRVALSRSGRREGSLKRKTKRETSRKSENAEESSTTEYNCNKCGHNYFSRFRLERHKKTLHYKLDKCADDELRSKYRGRVKKSDKSEKDAALSISNIGTRWCYRCRLCTFSTYRYLSLKKHVVKMHQSEAEKAEQAADSNSGEDFSHSGELLRSLDVLRKAGHFCDLVIKCDPSEEEFLAHRVVMCAASRVLKSQLLDAGASDPCVTTIITSWSSATVKLLIEYAYSGVLSRQTLTDSTARELMSAAKEWKLTNLEEDCASFLGREDTVVHDGQGDLKKADNIIITVGQSMSDADEEEQSAKHSSATDLSPAKPLFKKEVSKSANKLTKYRCVHCAFSSYSLHFVQKHMRSSHKDAHSTGKKTEPKKNGKYKCSKCDYTSDIKFNYGRHIVRVHKAKGLENEPYYGALMLRMSDMQKSGVFCDVIIQSGASPDEVVMAHKLVLCASSAVLKEQLQGLSQSTDIPTLVVPWSLATVRALLYYVYLGRLLKLEEITQEVGKELPEAVIDWKLDSVFKNSELEEYAAIVAAVKSMKGDDEEDDGSGKPLTELELMEDKKKRSEERWKVLNKTGVKLDFACPICEYSAKHKYSVQMHMQNIHQLIFYNKNYPFWLLNSIADLLKEGLFSDMVLRCNMPGSSEEPHEDLQAHRIVMAAASGVLGSQLEAVTVTDQNVPLVVVPSNLHILKAFVTFVYSGQLMDLKLSAVEELRTVGDNLEVIISLKNKCEAKIKELQNPSTEQEECTEGDQEISAGADNLELEAFVGEQPSTSV